MLIHRTIRNKGVTLVELLVGLVVGSIVIAGAIGLFLTTSRSSVDIIRSARLQQEMRILMNLMTHDLRRTGYMGIHVGIDTNNDGAVNVEDVTYNPFSAGLMDVTVSAMTGETANSCVTFAYNLDKDSPPFVGVGASLEGFTTDNTNPYNNTALPLDTDEMEMFGYRLNSGVIEMRTGLDSSDNSFTCDTGVWAAATSPAISVSTLSYTLNFAQVELAEADIADGNDTCASGSPCQCIRTIDIVITASPSDDASITEELEQSINLRNDKLIATFNTVDICRE